MTGTTAPRGRTRGAGPTELEPSRDPMVAGSAGAVALLGGFRADPDAPLGAMVIGPGGSGKSALVAAVLRSARRRGVPTRRIRPGDDVGPEGDDAVLLVDDAHALDRDTLDRLADVADDPDARLLVTARPAPFPPGFSSLSVTLGRLRAPVVLAPLTGPGVGERVTAILGHRCPPPLADLVSALTGGVPALVDRLATTVRDGGPGALAAAAERGSQEIPAGALDHLRHAIEGIEAPTRRLLLALAVDAPAARSALADVLEVDRTALDELLERGRATGLVLASDVVPPLARRALLRLTGTEDRLTLGRRIAEDALARGGSVLSAAQPLLGAGLRGGGLPAVFTTAGDEALARSPDLAATLYAEAVTAGAPAGGLVLRRAEAAALGADFDTALRLADRVAADPGAPGHERALTVVATVMAHRGMVAAGSAMLAGAPDGTAVAVPGLVGTGALDGARRALATTAAPTGTSSMLRSAVDLMAEGVVESLGHTPGTASTALSCLTRAASLLEPVGSTVLLPDSPSALAALVAVHSGELDVADSVLRRALAAGLGGRALAARHHLLRAWIAMTRGDVAAARELVVEATPRRGTFEPRDEIVAAALEVGIARRAGDSAGLRSAWGRAREALVRHPVDLYVLQPLGELAVGAARLKEYGAVQAAWAEAEALLGRLGDPTLWRVTTSWHGMAAAITAEDVAGAERHGATLAGLAPSGTFAAALATASRVWLRALAGDIDPVAVEAAARGLHRLGWTWDGARLAGEAAIRTSDRRAMATLLACARSLSDTGRAGAEATGGGAGGTATSGLVPEPGEPSLSEREREVALLVLAGLTHKQIGARLYISSKTVEHHVARMRQRLGSGSRGELFARLRELVGDPGA